jgi:hypothetical protein
LLQILGKKKDEWSLTLSYMTININKD